MLVSELRADPQAALAAAGQRELAERLGWAGVPTPMDTQPPPAVQPHDAIDFDVIFLGGGLSLLLAAPLARAGARVAVFERQSVGLAQREWNASLPELQALVRCGVLGRGELAQRIVNQYRHGIVRWHGGRTHTVRGVLDCAVDASALLQLARDKALRAGVQLFEARTAGACVASDVGVRARLAHAGGSAEVTAHVLVDGRGAQSPYARTDLVCPTVGGVLEGLDEGDATDCIDPQVGEILVTCEGVEDGRQHVWEAFPGRSGQVTVYLFYYARRGDVPADALQALYRRFAATLPSYKRGRARLLRPTFGFIPGWSRLVPGPTSPHSRIVLVGDAAARHSPLTFCGFGAMLRSVGPLVDGIQVRLQQADGPAGRRRAARIATPRGTLNVDDRPLHTATGALAYMMARPPRRRPQALNELLDAAFASLADMGQGAFASLLQDTLTLRQFTAFLQRTARRHRAVWRLVWQCLGARRATRWATRVAAALARESLLQALAPQHPGAKKQAEGRPSGAMVRAMCSAHVAQVSKAGKARDG